MSSIETKVKNDMSCFEKEKSSSIDFYHFCDIVEDEGFCAVCNYSGYFTRHEVNVNVLRKLNSKPGIGRPYRYEPKLVDPFQNVAKPTERCRSALEIDHGDCLTMPEPALFKSTRQPIVCLHNDCRKSVTVCSLLNHFRRDHRDVQRYGAERGVPLDLIVDASKIEKNRMFCMGLVTVYEANELAVEKSRSCTSVRNALSFFSGRVPTSTFWLMMKGPDKRLRHNANVIFWLYSNTEERYMCKLELISVQRTVQVTATCPTVCLNRDRNLEGAKNSSLDSLFVSRGSLVAILREGDKITLRITVY